MKRFYYKGQEWSSATELVNFVREVYRRRGMDVNVIDYLVRVGEEEFYRDILNNNNNKNINE